MKKRANLIIKAVTAEEAQRYAKERFGPLWSEWRVQALRPTPTTADTQWTMRILFTEEDEAAVKSVLLNWYADPLWDKRESRYDPIHPGGTLLYYAKY